MYEFSASIGFILLLLAIPTAFGCFVWLVIYAERKREERNRTPDTDLAAALIEQAKVGRAHPTLKYHLVTDEYEMAASHSYLISALIYVDRKAINVIERLGTKDRTLIGRAVHQRLYELDSGSDEKSEQDKAIARWISNTRNR